MTDPRRHDDTRVREVLAACMERRFQAPLGVRLRACGVVHAAGTPEFRAKAILQSVGVVLANAGFMVCFVFIGKSQGVIGADQQGVLIVLAGLWGLLVGMIVFALAKLKMGRADRMPALLRADPEWIESPNGGWKLARSETSGLVAWSARTRDRGAQRVHMRMEYLTLVTTDGRLHPVFVTRVAIDRTRADVRAWCSRNEVHLSEYKPAEQDRPWTADVPVDLQAGL